MDFKHSTMYAYQILLDIINTLVLYLSKHRWKGTGLTWGIVKNSKILQESRLALAYGEEPTWLRKSFTPANDLRVINTNNNTTSPWELEKTRHIGVEDFLASPQAGRCAQHENKGRRVIYHRTARSIKKNGILWEWLETQKEKKITQHVFCKYKF